MINCGTYTRAALHQDCCLLRPSNVVDSGRVSPTASKGLHSLKDRTRGQWPYRPAHYTVIHYKHNQVMFLVGKNS